MLQYPGEWKFADVAEIPAVPTAVVYLFHDILVRVVAGAPNSWRVIESFKQSFGASTGSSSEDWAVTDLRRAMEDRSLNAVVFIDALWTAVEHAQAGGFGVPSVEQLNAVLRRNGVGYELRPPALVRSTGDAVVAATPGSALNDGQRYVLGDLIGRGGFGHVFSATRETSVGLFEFALKRLEPSPFVDADKALMRFRREVAALQALQHRGIVSYVDAGVDQEGRPYVVMPRINGLNIRDWAEGRQPLECVSVMAEVLLALAYAHDNNVLHRDLKPSNILVRTSDTQPMVLDFGNSYLMEEMDGPSLTSTAVGSVGYMPPEVLADPKVRSPVQDVFACGVITFEIIARHRPDPLTYNPLHPRFGTPPALDQVLQRALGAAAHRPQSARALRDALIRACWPPA